jgi:hypothetical protein
MVTQFSDNGKDAAMAKLTDHTRAGELFSAYIDQRTTADEQAFVERHVAACAACRAELQSTRSMVAALKAMPVVRAPRSFVLPKSMAVQPKPSIFNWYPALRLATVMAAVAFVLVFAGDLLTVRPNGGGNVVMSASSPSAEAPAAPAQAPAAAPLAKSSPTDQQPPSAEPVPAGAAPAAGNAVPAQPTATMETADMSATALRAQITPTETMSAYAMTATVEATATAALTQAVEPTPEPAVESPAPVVTTAVPQAIDPLRLASIVLGGLVVSLGAITLIIRRGA